MPADFVHPILGALAYDGGLNWYSGEQASKGVPRLHLALDDCSDEAAFVEQASRKIERLPACVIRAKEAASSLLVLANSEWLPKGVPLLDVSSFMAKLTVDSFTFYPDGSAEVLFRAGDLFAGHAVLVSIDATGRATGPAICG
jgi:hypothetical protein